MHGKNIFKYGFGILLYLWRKIFYFAHHWYVVLYRYFRIRKFKIFLSYLIRGPKYSRQNLQGVTPNDSRKVKVMIGSSGFTQKGFISTEIDTLDITSSMNWRWMFNKNSIDNLLAEHVLEHLTYKHVESALRNCYKYLKPGGKFRIAVPDKNRKEYLYKKEVAPPAYGHKSYFEIAGLTKLLESVGFRVEPLEYFDDKGTFNSKKWEIGDGKVRRSLKYDKQKKFKKGKLFYTSLIVDAIKPSQSKTPS